MNHGDAVSIVIPCRNEVQYIRRCVEACLRQTYPFIEVLVIDGMSDDGTREVLAELIAHIEACRRENSNGPQRELRVIDNPLRLTPYAFNLGVKSARGDWIQIVGSRNVMAEDYVERLHHLLVRRPDVACVGGDYQHIFDNEQGRWISCAMESRFGVGTSNYRTQRESGFVDTVGVPLYRKSIFSEVGLFDESLTRNQDDEFNFRLTQAGHKIYYLHEAKVTYRVRSSLVKAYQQYFQYGYFKVFVNRKHKTLTTLRQLVPFLFVLFLLWGGILGVFFEDMRILVLVTLLVYAVVGYVASVKFTGDFWSRLKIQRAIFVLHMGYGMGYLRGVLDFLILNRPPSARCQQQTT